MKRDASALSLGNRRGTLRPIRGTYIHTMYIHRHPMALAPRKTTAGKREELSLRRHGGGDAVTDGRHRTQTDRDGADPVGSTRWDGARSY